MNITMPIRSATPARRGQPQVRPRDLSLDCVIDRALGLALDRARAPSAAVPKRLNSLFRALTGAQRPSDADSIEALIWAVWIDHPDAAAHAAIDRAGNALMRREVETARPILDQLIESYPDWPEPWNKRAILATITGDHRAAIADIAETLRREPRHFGALSGLGQLCLELGRPREAALALSAALAVNPHLEGVAELIAEIEEDLQPVH